MAVFKLEQQHAAPVAARKALPAARPAPAKPAPASRPAKAAPVESDWEAF